LSDDPYKNVKLENWQGPPYWFQVWIRGEKAPRKMSGFDAEHIRLQIRPKTAKKILKLKDDG
jgi:hypothetical protein